MNPEEQIFEKARKIKLLLLDVDGVLTDGRIILGSHDEELKAFNVHDGLGITLLQSIGIPVGLITKRQSAVVARRAAELKIAHVYQGQKDKLEAYQAILEKTELQEEQAAYMGDDLPDLPLLLRVGLSATVKDGVEAVKEKVDWVSSKKGGRGAVRELCELIMKAQNNYAEAVARLEHPK